MGPRFFNRGNSNASSSSSPRSAIASMGPRFFNRGNIENARVNTLPATGLQWGRGFSTAEIAKTAGVHGPADTASMGPRFFNRGNVWNQVATHKLIVASMGPRFFNRGNLILFASLGGIGWCFNGAAVFQPRKWHTSQTVASVALKLIVSSSCCPDAMSSVLQNEPSPKSIGKTKVAPASGQGVFHATGPLESPSNEKRGRAAAICVAEPVPRNADNTTLPSPAAPLPKGDR